MQVCTGVGKWLHTLPSHPVLGEPQGYGSGTLTNNTTLYIYRCREMAAHTTFSPRAGWTSGFWLRNTIKQHYTDTDTTEALYLLCISTPSSHSTLVLSVAAFVVWRMLYDFLLFLSLWQILCWWTKMDGIKFQLQWQKQQQNKWGTSRTTSKSYKKQNRLGYQ